MSTNVYAKFFCAVLRSKKAIGIFRELITTTATRTTRIAFWHPTSGSKNKPAGFGESLVTTLLHIYCRAWWWNNLQKLIQYLVKLWQKLGGLVFGPPCTIELWCIVQHDSGPECVPTIVNPNFPDGNFIMFASATSGDRPNNHNFSTCSIGNMTLVSWLCVLSL